MDYAVRCILPNNRYLYYDKLRFVATADPEVEGEQRPTYVNYYASDGSQQTLDSDSFGARFSFEYIHRLVFLHEKELRSCTFEQSVDEELGYPNLDESHIAFLLSGQTSRLVSVRHIGLQNGNDLGHGLYAEEDLPAGSFIGEYVGLVSSVVETTMQQNHYNLLYPSCDGGLEINAREQGNIIRFINHSDNPNAEFRCIKVNGLLHVICITTGDITANVQLTVNYGGAFWCKQLVTPSAI